MKIIERKGVYRKANFFDWCQDHSFELIIIGYLFTIVPGFILLSFCL